MNHPGGKSPKRSDLPLLALDLLLNLNGIPARYHSGVLRVFFDVLRAAVLVLLNLYLVYRVCKLLQHLDAPDGITFNAFALINAAVSCAGADSIAAQRGQFAAFSRALHALVDRMDVKVSLENLLRLSGFCGIFAAYLGVSVTVFPFSSAHWFDTTSGDHAQLHDLLHHPSVKDFTHVFLFLLCGGSVVCSLATYLFVCVYLQEMLRSVCDGLRETPLAAKGEGRGSRSGGRLAYHMSLFAEPVGASDPPPRGVSLAADDTGGLLSTAPRGEKRSSSFPANDNGGDVLSPPPFQLRGIAEDVDGAGASGSGPGTRPVCEDLPRSTRAAKDSGGDPDRVGGLWSRPSPPFHLIAEAVDGAGTTSDLRSGLSTFPCCVSLVENEANALLSAAQFGLKMSPLAAKARRSKLAAPPSLSEDASERKAWKGCVPGNGQDVRPDPYLHEVRSKFIDVARMVYVADGVFSLFGFVCLACVFCRACAGIHFYLNVRQDFPGGNSLFFICVQVAFDLAALASLCCFAASVAEEAHQVAPAVFLVINGIPARRIEQHLHCLNFAKVVLSSQVQMSAWKLFPFSRRVLPTVVGFTLSYVAVIIQMHHAATVQRN